MMRRGLGKKKRVVVEDVPWGCGVGFVVLVLFGVS